ncbi:MAG: YggT family protein [Gammaproteobacteria bacterium]|nr:YggT family protein [Gammaproteobacteria bacterium]
MDNFLINSGSYLISTLFGLYIIIVLLRFLLQLVRADFYNPLSQFIVKATSPVLNPLRRLIPGLFGIDISSLLLAYFLQYIENILLFAVRGIPVNPIFLLWHSIGSLLTLFLYIYFFAILIQVIISWVSPGTYNPATAMIHHITEPVMRPARKILPPFSGFDLSPILVFVVLNIMIMFIPVLFG